MAVEIRVPTLGESVAEATVGRWLKAVGDSVAADEPVAEPETGTGADPRIAVRADSDAHIVRGLVALAIAAYDGRPASEIRAHEMDAVLRRIGLDEHLTPQRANGFASLVGRIKAEAAAAGA